MEKLRYLLIVFCVLLIFDLGISQNHFSSEWLVNSTGNSWSTASDEAIDNAGNIYLTGNFTSGMKMGTNPTKLSGEDCIFYSKLGANGKITWIKQISCSEYCHVTSICIDSIGSIFISGVFKGELGEGISHLNSDGKKSAFIYKFDSLGNIKWGTKIEGSFGVNHIFISTDNCNSLFFTGSFKGTLTLGNEQIVSKNFFDIIIAKFNYEGKLTDWTILKGKGDDKINDILVDKNKDIYLTGSYEKELIINDRTLFSKGGTDIFLIKLDDKLQLINVVQYGGYYDDSGRCLGLDNNNGLILSGTFIGDMSMEDSLVIKSNGRSDVFIVKFDSFLKIIWSDSFGGISNDFIVSIAVNNLGNIYLNGNFKGKIEKNNQQIESIEFSIDNFLAKYDTDGKFCFFESIGNEFSDYGKGLITGNDNNLYLTGNFSKKIKIQNFETMDLDSNALFITKLYDCDAAISVKLPLDTAICGNTFELGVEDEFETYLWNEIPGKNQIEIDSTGYYILTAIDQHKCTSKDTVYVQLNKPPEFDLGGPYTLYQGESMTLYAPDGMKEYLWSDGTSSVTNFVDCIELNIGMNEVSLKITDDNECSSEFYTVIELADTLSLNNNTLSENSESYIKLFPNPVDNNLFVNILKSNSNKSVIIKLITLEGELILEKNVKLNETGNTLIKLNLEPFSPGIYSVYIYSNGSFSAHKIIKL